MEISKTRENEVLTVKREVIPKDNLLNHILNM